MCGRYTLTAPNRIRDHYPEYGFEEFSEYRLPRFNIAPSQRVLGVRNDGCGLVEPLQWGSHGRINVRAESIVARGSARRCILFADGFYEWHDRAPTYFTLRDGGLFTFAGLWESNADIGAACTIVTCPPNSLVAPIHTRMPVILPRDRIALWLSNERLPSEVTAAILRPYDPAEMRAQRVSSRLNNARYDAPDVLNDDAPEQRSLFTP